VAVRCPDCSLEFFAGSDRCPHCGRPSRFPNVDAAGAPEEVAALEARYASAMADAAARGVTDELGVLEAVGASSKVVFARFPHEVQRLAQSDKELYATWYDLLDGGLRLPAGDRWDVWRTAADAAVFPGYAKNIRFGVLSVNDRGPKNYGECFLVARSDMVQHRASVFEENTVMFLVHQRLPFDELVSLPHGFRAPWDNRARLTIAKLAGRVNPGDDASRIAALLVVDRTNETDEFVEAHVFGPMTIRTFERVVWVGTPLRRSRFRVLRETLRRYGIPLEER
jgi:hypothetical protein